MDSLAKMEVVKTQKGKDALYLDGYKYCFQRLKKDEATSRVSLMQLSNGGQGRKRLKKWNEKDDAIKELEDDLRDGDLNLNEFLQKIQCYWGI